MQVKYGMENRNDKNIGNCLFPIKYLFPGSIHILISITGTSSTDTVVDLSDFSGDDIRNAIIDKYVSFTYILKIYII